ncbi:MAG: hypothetical protein J6W28_03370 [Clostridia bacterium]|nr:hypothetical protein [Clostridia bacterium]
MADSGKSEAEMRRLVAEIESTFSSKATVKAKIFEAILTHAPIAVEKSSIFQDKVLGYRLMKEKTWLWEQQVKDAHFPELAAQVFYAGRKYGAYSANSDFGHTSPNTRLLLEVGFSGLLSRVRLAAAREGLTEKQKTFYESCETVLSAMMTVAHRLADATAPYNEANAVALRHIAEGAPSNSYEAMQLLLLYFFLHEYVAGTRVRTLGRLDVLLCPFYRRDLENGVCTKEEFREMLRFFLYEFYAADVPYGLPFCLGGVDAEGDDVTNEVSYLIVETYDELNIHSPKIHIRVSDRTPKDFILLVLRNIRGGNSSYVFVNDRIGIESLRRVGIEEKDARDYVPIGCYEPAVWGVEIGCTGNGCVNLPKAVELVLEGGRDFATGDLVGLPMTLPTTFDEFLTAVKDQIAYMTDQATGFVTTIEQYYGEISPDPILSSQYEHSVEKGVDVYEGGAKYNNSSMTAYSIASLVDALCAVKRLVFEEGRFTLSELREVLRADWQGHEADRQYALRLPEKYGNGHPVADALAVEISSFFASLINGKPNGRGGVFKAANFSIDHCFTYGEKTMATPDGRHAGAPLSKNLCPTAGMDRKGITAVIGSVTKMDLADFPTGSVLDVVLHPSAVKGEEGLGAFYSILMTYFAKGGFAMHGNVFDAELLKKAQQSPEEYQNLQVRLCGWNAYFVNLTRAEQDSFIAQAGEH